MKVVIVGAGLLGLTTAYFLSRRGHQVTVIDREEGPGLETSFANGSLLTPSMAEPWNAPGSWRVLLASLVRSDSPLQLRVRAVPSLMGWGIGFLRNSRAATYERNVLSNLSLALHSLEVMQSLHEETGIDYARVKTGTLKVFREHAAFGRACEWAARLAPAGLSFKRLSRDEVVNLEPGLAPIANQLAGALRYESDEIGDAYRFCVALADRGRQQGVRFRFGTQVSSLELQSGKVTAVLSDRERFVADRYVVAAGSFSTPLLQRAGVNLPVRPAKGYSITIPAAGGQAPLAIPVVDDRLHAAVVPLKGAIRVAGTAEFAGYDRTLRPERIRNLLDLLREVLPQWQFDPAKMNPWCGLRPMSMDGVPIIGPTPISNLWVNAGHGHLGWTMAAGSGQLLAELMCDERPSIDPAPFSLARFAAA